MIRRNLSWDLRQRIAISSKGIMIVSMGYTYLRLRGWYRTVDGIYFIRNEIMLILISEL